MSDYSTAYRVTCFPGENAGAVATRGPGGNPVLVVYLDPVNLTLHSEPTEAGSRGLATFCRELAREAAKLAAVIDPDGEPAPPEYRPRHLLVKGPDGESGAGY